MNIFTILNHSIQQQKSDSRAPCFHSNIILCSDLEVLHQASAGDFAAVDFLHIDVAGTEEPGNQNLQVVYKLAVDF